MMTDTLPNTAELLVMGGDARIALNAPGGVNRYGCGSMPVPDLLDFASSTASVISPNAYQAADRLRSRLLQDLCSHSPALLYARELSRIRQELLALCMLGDLPEPDVVFAASGTDLHHIVAKLATASREQAVLAIMVDESETGSGVHAALRTSSPHIQIATVALRHSDGIALDSVDIDAEFTHLAQQAVAAGQRVLLIHVDVSKTGMIAPSYACTAALQSALGQNLDVLIDACQFRIAPATLRACLARGYNVALTGSKFLGGPSFSGVLLMPARNTMQTCEQDLADATHNFGLLLRWEAALCELRRFRELADADIAAFLRSFALAIRTRLNDDPAFAEVNVPALDRSALHSEENWDGIQTIFPFQLYRTNSSGRIALDVEATQHVYRRLTTTTPRCRFGQAVHYATDRHALRLCLSTTLIARALTNDGAREDIIASALRALDQVAHLAHYHAVHIVHPDTPPQSALDIDDLGTEPPIRKRQRTARG